MDGAKQFLRGHLFGDNAEHRSAGRTNFSDTYPTPAAWGYGGALGDWKDPRRVEFTEDVQGDEVTMCLTHHFVDGSIDDETATYRQQGTFRLVRNHHIQSGPFFPKPFNSRACYEVHASSLNMFAIMRHAKAT
jgi:hypothetical protein